MDVHYTILKDKKNLVTLLHGLGEDSTIVQKQVDFLHQYHFSTLTMDLRGHGKTPLEGKVSVSSHAEELGKVLEKEGVENTCLVGFSLGGTVALEYTYRHPEQVDKLLLINPGLYHKDFMTWNVKMLYPFFPLLKKTAKYDQKVRVKQADLSKAIFSNAYYSLPNGLKNTNLQGLYENIKAFMEHGVPEYLDRIDTRTLIIRSRSDELIKEGASDLLLKRLKNSARVRVRGNHTVVLSNSEEVNENLWIFLNQD